MVVSDYLEILAQFALEHFKTEMLTARDEYFKIFGIVHETDDLFEEVTKDFLDLFIFEHPVGKESITPIRKYLEKVTPSAPPDEAAVIKDFAEKGRKSLFLIKKVSKSSVILKDLFTRQKWIIAEDEPTGFFKGEICEARLLPLEGVWRFGDLLRFHPVRANKIIIKAAKPIKDSETSAAKELLKRLAEAKVKHYRFPRIDLLKFYREAVI